MSVERCHVGRASVFVAVIALSGSLLAQSGPAPGAPQGPGAGTVSPKPPAPPAKSNDAVSAPGAAAGDSNPVKVFGNVGPDGKVAGQGTSASPDGDATVKNPALEQLGPGGTATRTGAEQMMPAGTANQAQTAAPPARQPPAPKAAVSSDGGQAVKPPAASGGVQVFIDPTTGEIVEPSAAQLRELNQQQQAASPLAAQPAIVERPGEVSGFAIDVPASRFPLVTATVGGDGKVTLGERQAGTAAPAVKRDVSVRPDVAARVGRDGVTADAPPRADVTVSIVNLDGVGEGFNDPTAVAPVFGNTGTTLGQQRLNVFRAAAAYWGAILKSTVPILVDARMDPQFCTATSAVLGSAGPNNFFRDFTGAPQAATWYAVATANSRFGGDLQAGVSDIDATFNSDVDNPTCLGSTSWWYGIGAPAPAGTIDMFTVVLHEIGHGIGVLTIVDQGTGAKALGFDDAYERYLFDVTAGLGWPAMSNAQRLASQVNTGNVTFQGPRATEAARGLLTAGLNNGFPRVYTPNPLQPGSSVSHFDTVLTPNELMEPAITPPPGPYAFVTGGLLEDVGWRLLANGVFDFGAQGTWTWSRVNGFANPSADNPTLLAAWNGNFVGAYPTGTWLWNGTTGAWTQLSPSIPTTLKGCADQLLWGSPTLGFWRWNATSGWAQLSGSAPDALECFGTDAVFDGAVGTWIYRFSTGVWTQITASDATGILPCGSRLVWWGGGITYYWEAASGWHPLTSAPESAVCYRGQLAWEGPSGTWLYTFTTNSWVQISTANPDQMVAWGPSLAWESASNGTWIYEGTAWAQITTDDATQIQVLGPDLLWSGAVGTWVWGGAGGGAGWNLLTASVATQIVSTGAIQ